MTHYKPLGLVHVLWRPLLLRLPFLDLVLNLMVEILKHLGGLQSLSIAYYICVAMDVIWIGDVTLLLDRCQNYWIAVTCFSIVRTKFLVKVYRRSSIQIVFAYHLLEVSSPFFVYQCWVVVQVVNFVKPHRVN